MIRRLSLNNFPLKLCLTRVQSNNLIKYGTRREYASEAAIKPSDQDEIQGEPRKENEGLPTDHAQENKTRLTSENILNEIKTKITTDHVDSVSESSSSSTSSTSSSSSVSSSSSLPPHRIELPDDLKDIPSGFSLFHKKSKTLISIKKVKERSDVSLFFPKSSSILDIPIDYGSKTFESMQKVLQQEKLDSCPAHNINSVDEHVWQEMKTDRSKLINYYLKLSKIRLTGLVVLTSMAGYAMAPAPFNLVNFMAATLGTTLTSSSANAINQFMEVPFDSQMNRTKNRVLVREHISPLHAVLFATVSGATGVAVLALGANPLTAGLGFFNLILYTLVYTPMKRMSIVNTWVGSIVGAVPPMMGWAACTGALDPGAWLLAAIMFAWQFPHFNALSWNLRQDYSRAGYRMMSVVDPALCKRVAFRHTLGIIGLSALAPIFDVTSPLFVLESLPLNSYFAYLGWKFYRNGDSNSSRKLFKFSLLHIPLIIVLLILNKKEINSEDKAWMKKFRDILPKIT